MVQLKNYLSLIKFSHTIFALPFAFIGFVLGVIKDSSILHSISLWQRYGYKFSLVLVCMVTARSAAMAFNRYLDRQYDAKNPRTAIREIPAGTIKARSALTFVIINCIIFVVAAYLINLLCFYLAPIALIVVLGYSYTKRFTALCHLILGVGLSLAPIGAYLAVTGVFNWLPILFSFIVLCWVSGFDIIYALQDEAFDKAQQLHSIPVLLGKTNALWVSRLLHIISASLVFYAMQYGKFGTWYLIGAVLFSFLLVRQHLIVKPGDLSKVNMAFFTLNGIASVVFAIFVITDLFW